ncbi:Replication protein A 70 kDa DNA-binding subunit B [Linum grandiflorum]
MLLSEISFDNPPTELLLRLEHVWKLGNPSRPERYFALGTMWTDASGVRIQGDSPRNFANALQDLISVGSIYKITGYTFRSPRPTFRTCRFPRWLDLGPGAKFELQAPPPVPFAPELFEFVPISKFPARVHSCPYLTDFVGKIIGIGKPNYVARGDSTAPVQTVRVLDSSGGEVEVSLWSEMSSIIDADAVVLDDVSNPVIVVFSCFGVGEFRGKSTASSYTASRVFLDPGHPAAVSLREIFATQERSITYITPKFPTPEKLQQHIQDSHRTIKELLAMYEAGGDSDPLYRCTASIIGIDRDQPWYYKACSQCSCAVLPNGNDYWCKKHDTIKSSDIVFRYKLKLSVSDSTAKTTFIMLGHAADRIMPITAVDLALAYPNDYGELPPQLQSLVGQHLTFGVHLPYDVHANAYGDCRIARIWGLVVPCAQLPPPPAPLRSPSPPSRHNTPIPPDPSYVPPIPTYQITTNATLSTPSTSTLKTSSRPITDALEKTHATAKKTAAILQATRTIPASAAGQRKRGSPSLKKNLTVTMVPKTLPKKSQPVNKIPMHVQPPNTPALQSSRASTTHQLPTSIAGLACSAPHDVLTDDIDEPLSSFVRKKRKSSVITPSHSDLAIPAPDVSVNTSTNPSPSIISQFPLAKVKLEKLAAASAEVDETTTRTRRRLFTT